MPVKSADKSGGGFRYLVSLGLLMLVLAAPALITMSTAYAVNKSIVKICMAAAEFVGLTAKGPPRHEPNGAFRTRKRMPFTCTAEEPN
jgi:hypothetical protein